jgi:hypothetical protein
MLPDKRVQELWRIRKGRKTARNHNKGKMESMEKWKVWKNGKYGKMESMENCILNSFFHFSMLSHLLTKF